MISSSRMRVPAAGELLDRRFLRRAALVVVALASLVAPSSAPADEKSECIAAHEEGQLARRDGRFDRAREAFAICQADACPALIRSRCAEFARDLEAAQPTMVILVRDARGGDIGDARVGIDGGPPASMSAVALRLNPGKHRLHVEAPGFLPVDRTVMLPESVKDMQVIVSMQSNAPSPAVPPKEIQPPPPPPDRPKTAAWAFAIGSGVSLLAAGGLSAAGWAVHSNLQESCGATGCTDSQVEPLRILWPASFAALGVGVVTGIVAAVLFSSGSRPTTASALILGPDGAFHFQ
jgi:hypothetical protein